MVAVTLAAAEQTIADLLTAVRQLGARGKDGCQDGTEELSACNAQDFAVISCRRHWRR